MTVDKFLPDNEIADGPKRRPRFTLRPPAVIPPRGYREALRIRRVVRSQWLRCLLLA